MGEIILNESADGASGTAETTLGGKFVCTGLEGESFWQEKKVTEIRKEIIRTEKFFVWFCVELNYGFTELISLITIILCKHIICICQ